MKFISSVVLSVLVIVNQNHGREQSKKPPNIFIILADDLGRNDVSYNNNQNFIVTPNIDALGYYGIILNRFYAHAMCTPSRGALMTGKYCIHTGLQHSVINNDEPYGMDPETKILPQFLRDVGYKTHLIGKWHLGMYKRRYNPIQRGFDSFYGYLGGYVTYHGHDYWQPTKPFWPRGYDIRSNETLDYGSHGVHATEMFTEKAIDVINRHNTSEPLFLMVSHLAPHSENLFIPFPRHQSKYEHDYKYIKNPIRRRLAIEMSLLDECIGRTIVAIKNNGMLDNSIILFMSDNGAPSLGILYNLGSNYPLRGQKNSPFDGATRVPAVVWSPLLKQREYVSNHLMHITDWMVTLANLGGADLSNHSVDGINVWDTLSNNRLKSPRTSIVHNIDDYTSYLRDDWKYVKGTTNFGLFDWWIGDIFQRESILNPHHASYYTDILNSPTGQLLKNYRPNRKEITQAKINRLRKQTTLYCTRPKILCLPAFFPCLFNILDDPCERENLYHSRTDIVKQIEEDLIEIRATIVPKRNVRSDKDANPANFNNTWNWWQGY